VEGYQSNLTESWFGWNWSCCVTQNYLCHSPTQKYFWNVYNVLSIEGDIGLEEGTKFLSCSLPGSVGRQTGEWKTVRQDGMC
jgi:hypothetical protein